MLQFVSEYFLYRNQKLLIFLIRLGAIKDKKPNDGGIP